MRKSLDMATVKPLLPLSPSSTVSDRAQQASSTVSGGLLSAGLVCAFGLWFSWAPLIVHLQQVGANFSPTELFSLLAIAGLSAACLRLTLGFLLPTGAEPMLFTSCVGLLMVTAWALYQLFGSAVFELWQLQGLALLSGVGGGCLSALGQGPGRTVSAHSWLIKEIAAAVGHLGIVASLMVLPLLVTLALLHQQSVELVVDSSHFLGRVNSGQRLWLGWAGLFWAVLLVPVFLLSLVSLRRSFSAQSLGSFGKIFAQVSGAGVLGLFLALVGAALILPTQVGGLEFPLALELGLVILILLALAALRFWPDHAHASGFMRLIPRADTWIMSVLWAMSIGSFLGFAAAFPLTFWLLFAPPEGHSGPGYPGIFLYAWMLPLVAIVIRVLGSWCARRWGPVLITQICATALVLASLAAAHWMLKIQQVDYSAPYFSALLWCFALIFIAAGIAHASLANTLSVLFPGAQARWVWVWLSSVAALGVVYIPLLLARHLEQGTPWQAMAGFALFYAGCFTLNGWFYWRRRSEFC